MYLKKNVTGQILTQIDSLLQAVSIKLLHSCIKPSDTVVSYLCSHQKVFFPAFQPFLACFNLKNTLILAKLGAHTSKQYFLSIYVGLIYFSSQVTSSNFNFTYLSRFLNSLFEIFYHLAPDFMCRSSMRRNVSENQPVLTCFITYTCFFFYNFSNFFRFQALIWVKSN